jgi:ATP-dependent DNA helicase RecG
LEKIFVEGSLMTHRESETIELKKSTAELKNGVVSIASILNKHGKGMLYFGIKDDGTVVGQEIGRHTIKEVTQTIVDNIEPKIYPKVAARKINGADCIVVEFQGSEIPYFAYGKAYMRVGESDKQMTAKHLEDQFRNKKYSWEREISEKTLKDVNVATMRAYMRRANEAGRINFKYTNVHDTLKKLGLLSGKKLTNAAEVLFCEPFLLEFQAAVFAGTDKITFLDIRSFKGNIFSLREQAENYIKEHIKWRAEITSGPRKEIPEIPVEAIREAVGNSLCHRDYSNPKGNEVAVFKDRVEIYNPGQFPDEIEPEDFIKGRGHSILRNPLIAETMFRSEDIEKWASGIKRIYDECTAAGVKIEFNRVKTGFVVIFYRPKWEEGEGLGEGGQKGWSERVVRKGGQKLTTKQIVLLDLLKQNPVISRKDIAKKLGINESAVQKRLDSLRKKGILRRVGPDKGGYWQVAEK